MLHDVPQALGFIAYEEVIAASSSAAPQVMVSLDDLERIAYTSGTTGRPKGIMKTMGNNLAQLRNDFLNEDQMTTADDVMLNVAPLTHASRGPCVAFALVVGFLASVCNVAIDQKPSAGSSKLCRDTSLYVAWATSAIAL